MRTGLLFALGSGLIVAGFVAVVVGSVNAPGSSVGAVVFIGPVPIVFGTGSNGTFLALIATVLAVGMILVFFLQVLMRRRTKAESA